MKKLLITGGAGFIGSNFVEHILKNTNYKCIILDALKYSGNINNFKKDIFENKNFKFIKGDIRDRNLVEKIIKKCDVVINLAAESHVDKSYDDPISFVSTNVLGTATLLEAIRKYPVEKFIHLSTPEVFGTALTKKINEDHPLKPMSPYAGSKAGADRLCYSYYVAYNLPVIILKPSNNYGANQYPEKLIPLFITNALENKPLPIYGNGKSIRDWIYVKDTCNAILKVIEGDIEKLRGEEIIIATEEIYDVITIANMIINKLNKSQSLIKFIEDRPGHVERFTFSVEKIKRLLKWKHKVSFDKGINMTIKWYIENKKWWKQIKKKPEYISFYKNWYGKLGLFKKLK